MRSRAGIALASVLLLAGCSSTSGEEDGAPTPAASSSGSGSGSASGPGTSGTELSAEWSADVAAVPFRGAQTIRPGEGVNPIEAGSTALVLGDDLVTALDVATGAVLWTQRLPDVVCASAPTADQDGVAVVLVGGDDCSTAVAIDTATGDVRWSVPVPRAAAAVGQEVQVGPGVVVVAGECAGFSLLSAADGSVVGGATGREVDGQCPSATSDGTSVVMSSAGRLTVFDATTGARVSQTPVDGLGRMGDVLAADPLVATVAPSSSGFLVDLSAATPRFFGYDEAGFGGAPEASVQVGGVLWVQDVDAQEMLAYDLASHEQVAAVDLSPGGRLVGQHDGRLVVTSTTSDARTELRLVDPSPTAEAEVVGLLPPDTDTDAGLSSSAVLGDHLVRVWGTTRGGTRVEAVRLPTSADETASGSVSSGT